MIFALGYNTALVLAGVALLGAAAGVIGSYAVLRRRSLTGDALAHAALPGLCISFVIVGEREFHALLLGAFISGLAGIATISALRRWTRLKEDAAITIVLSVFYGLGVVLLSVISRLPGLAGRAGLDSFILGQAASMSRQDLESISLLALGTLFVVLLLYKEFKLVTFDPAFAQVQGWPAFALDGLLQLMLVVAVIIGLPAVGIVLMAALLVIPGAAARFWTERLGWMLLFSACIGLLAGLLGTVVSTTDVPTGPAVILAAALLFLISLCLGPRRGLIARWLEQRGYERRVQSSQLLEALYERSPLAPPAHRATTPPPGVPLASRRESTTEEALRARLHWSARRLGRWLAWARQQGLIDPGEQGILLSEEGKLRAAQVVQNKERWRQLLLEDPHQVPALLRLDLLPPDALPASLTPILSAAPRQPASRPAEGAS